MAKLKKEAIEGYKKRIEYLENLCKSIYRKGVEVTPEGTVEVKMSAAELERLVDIEAKLNRMKIEAASMEEVINEQEDEVL